MVVTEYNNDASGGDNADDDGSDCYDDNHYH